MQDYKDKTKKFLASTGGNVTSVFALLSLPLLAAVGGAVDYTAAVSTKSKLQNALDTAAAAVCSTTATTPDETLRSRLDAALPEFGLQLMPAPPEGQTPAAPTGTQASVVNTGFDLQTGILSPSITTNMPTSIMGIVGVSDLAIEVATSLRCSGKKLELSLMLDVSGSMDDSINGTRKVDSMKQAALDVVDIFRLNLSSGATRIAMVPFAKGVKLGSYAEAARGPITPGASAIPGSLNLKFDDWDSNQHTWHITDCVTERTGPEAYTDAPPSTAYVGRMYRQGGSCMTGGDLELVPLSSDAAALEAAINNYDTDGNTAGQIGTAWAWYTVSEQWASFWPTGSKPEAPNPDELIKATILMTDGRYNTQYCNDVEDETINCVALNGSAQDQAAALCTAMKAQGIVVYTVGFDISPGSSQESLLKTCATDDSKWFFPYDGDELRVAFQSIGKSLASGQQGYPIFTK